MFKLLLTSSTPTYVNEDVVTEIGGLMTTVLGWVTTNPMLTIFFTMSLVYIAIRLFKKLKNAVR